MRSADARQPGLLHVALAPAPYRVHLCQRIAREIPELRLHTAFLRSYLSGHEWELDLPPEINAVHFAVGHERAEEKWWRHPWRDHAKARRLIEYVREHDVRAAIVYGYTTWSMQRLYRYCRRHGIASFFLGDSNIRNFPPKTVAHEAAKRLLLTPIIRRCTGVMSMGELGDQYFLKYGADPDRIFRVPNEPDYESIRSVTPAEIARFRAMYGLSADRRYMIYSGRIVWWKRLDLLVDAFAAIADERPAWDVLILGDGETRPELESRVPERLRDRVRWLGYCQMDTVRVAYPASDLLVLPSDSEPWALVVNEAMAAGLPVVASDVCGAPWEMVRGQGCGRIFPKGDLDAFVEALRDVTDETQYAACARAVAPALERWQRLADPIDGIRKALTFAGVIGRARHEGT